VNIIYGPPETDNGRLSFLQNNERMYFLYDEPMLRAKYLYIKLDAKNKVIDAKLMDIIY
jgi:hypothetical protein